MSEKILRCVRSVDCDPADVFRSDAVSVPSETTLSTMAGFVESFHSFFKHVKLLRRRVELDCKRLLHTYMEKATPYLTFTLLRFLPPLKDVGILGGFR